SVILGDFDSIQKKTLNELAEKGSLLIPSPAEKDETDTELGIAYALTQKAQEITIVGGIEGDRIDHILANITLAAKHSLPIRFVNGNFITWIAKGPQQVQVIGKTGDLLSLIPLSPNVTHITTTDLQYALHNETLYFGKSRGISNVFLKNHPTVTFSEGLLLF